MIADAVTAERIGATWLRAALAPAGDFGRRAEDAAVPLGPGDEAAATAELTRIVALAAQLDAEAVPRLRAALRAAPDIGPIAGRARAGDPLDDVDLWEVLRFADALAAIAQAWDAAGGAAAERPPALPGLTEALAPGRLPGGGFALDAAFDPALASARDAVAAREASFAQAQDAQRERVAAALGRPIAGDEFVVLRDEHAGPLPAGVRVVRESPAYRLCALELEPAGIAAARARDAALAALLDVETAARRTLAERVARDGAAIAGACAALGALDRRLARVAFVQRWGGCVPTFAGDLIALREATFPPLAEALAAGGRRYVAIDVAVPGVAVLTGPNMGGKTAALATLGFAAACVAAGVPPPARSAQLPLFARVAWLGDGAAERDRLLSSFGAEVVRARALLDEPARPLLALVDEFARTTGPAEGRALAIALVEAFRRGGIAALVATHLDGVGEAAGVAHLAIAGVDEARLAAIATDDVRAALEAIGAAMDYRVVPADTAAAGSDALTLARVLGLDAALVARAAALLGQSAAETPPPPRPFTT